LLLLNRTTILPFYFQSEWIYTFPVKVRYKRAAFNAMMMKVMSQPTALTQAVFANSPIIFFLPVMISIGMIAAGRAKLRLT
jgi:hypothetical protein